MKKFIILIFSFLLLSSCYNKPYCEELINQYKEVERSIGSEQYSIKIDKQVFDEMPNSYSLSQMRESEEKIKSLEKEKDRLRLELLSAHCPKRVLEKEGIIKVENKKNRP